jgi:hypothetical protein
MYDSRETIRLMFIYFITIIIYALGLWKALELVIGLIFA